MIFKTDTLEGNSLMHLSVQIFLLNGIWKKGQYETSAPANTSVEF